MTDQQKIKHVIDLFLDGKTTLEQERWLYEQFSRPDLDPSLKPMRRMMEWFASGLTEPAPVRRNPRRFRLLRIASIAAMIAIIISLGTFLLTRNGAVSDTDSDSEGAYTVCYLIRDGVKYTDPDVVLPEIAMIQSRTGHDKPLPPDPLPLPEQLFLDHLRKSAPDSYTYSTLSNHLTTSE